ncbi:MAG TPA: sugar-binding domain-containing protein, partial [Anaerolineaceae bacterium]|nr:sugar-binding domain-containing protein [Anaerolineaceae bacterium]
KIVNIHITPVDDANIDLERVLCQKYGLDEVIAVPVKNGQAVDFYHELGVAAADTLQRSLQNKEVIAITWGRTLKAVVNNLPAMTKPEIRVVQALGGINSPDVEINGSELARKLAQIVGARPILLSSPGLVASREIRDALIKDPQISRVIDLAARADIALVGVGALNLESLARRYNIISRDDFERLKARDVIGDIGLRYFNSQGEQVDDELHDRTIGLDLNQLRKVKRVIGVTGGPDKVESIRAALKGKLINVLITDDNTGKALLENSAT